MIAFLKRHILKVPYISLVNLIAGKEVVKELVADKMTVEQMTDELQRLLYDTQRKESVRMGYDEMARCLGAPGAPVRAARMMVELLTRRRHES